MRQVIIGTGAAGISAAKTIKGISDDDEIIMISEDETIQSRCMLHRYISGERDESTISFVDEDFFTKNNITWMGGKTVEKIDPESKEVILQKGKIKYDNLLIAAGSDSVIPPIGALRTAKNAFGLRHLKDAKAIASKAETSETIAVIGSGLVGLDAANALLALGKKVHVVEMAERILPLNLDSRGAETYQSLFEKHGCTFHLGKKVSDTVLNSVGDIKGVELSGGDMISCDMVVVATGVTPTTDFLEGSAIEVNRGIKVNDYLQTSAPSVYAAGDVTGLSGIWPSAANQGMIAGKNMCGQKIEYTDRYAIKNTINFFGLLSLAIGSGHEENGDIVKVREDKSMYQKVVIRDNAIVSIVLQGEISCSGFWQYLIKNGINIEDVEKSIWNISYADFCALDEDGQYMWAV